MDDKLVRMSDIERWILTESACIDTPADRDAVVERMRYSIPAVDAVEVRHGEWIFDFALGGSNFYKCSECGRQECLLEKYNADEYMPYCHCGAKMDREEERNATD